MATTTKDEAVTPTALADAAIAHALRESEYGFGDDEISDLAAAELEHGPVQNWSRTTFDEALGALKGRAAFEVVRTAKVGDVDDAVKRVSLPEKAPYLEYDAAGKPKDYDSRDPSQFYTDPETGKLYRWDGKGIVHPVAAVGHSRYGEVLLPDENEALAAINAGMHWFHRGLKVWVGAGGKLLADPRQSDRDAVRVALALRERTYENDGSRPFVNARFTPGMAA